MEKIPLTGLFSNEIASAMSFEKAFRGSQIYRWIYSGAGSFDEMTDLGKKDREALDKKAVIHSSSVSKTLNDPDGTVKLQISLHDGLAVETVLLTDRDGRKTACVSCQAGCAMGCAFCHTGQLGFARNLTAGEILEQFLFLEKSSGKLDNIVFMGMGEPMLNLDEIRKSIRILTDKKGRNLSARRITISTSGIIKGIYDLADNGPSVRLAVSLTTADEELRKILMPVSAGNPLSELKKAIDYYARKTGKRVTLEAALMKDVNTGKKSAEQLIDFASEIDVNVNLIPWNPVSTLPFKEPSREETKRFASFLENAGINVTLRTRRGRSIGGACGQLGRTEKRKI